MVAIKFDNFEKNILIIGPLYDRVFKLQNHLENLSNYELIIINGNAHYPNGNLDNIRNNIRLIENFSKSKNILYNLGEQDFLLMKQLRDTQQASDIINWFSNKSNVIQVTFTSQYNLIVTGGGILPNMTLSALYDNIETSFINKIGEKSWHDLYGGGCGYVISNNPLTKEKPKFYNFSLQIGNVYSLEANTYAVQVTPKGIGKIFSF